VGGAYGNLGRKGEDQAYGADAWAELTAHVGYEYGKDAPADQA